MEKISQKDMNFYISRMERYHSLFYHFVNIANIHLTNSVPLAAVSFNPKDGRPLNILFNKDKWDNYPKYDREFLIAHEILHIVQGHGLRLGTYGKEQSELTNEDTKFHKISNIAMDLEVNQLLTKSFGFDREKLEEFKGMWIDVVFPEKHRKKIEENMWYEYYYNRIFKYCDVKNIEVDMDVNWNMSPEEYQQLIDMALSNTTEEERKDIQRLLKENKVIQAGHEAFGKVFEVINARPKPKPKWETVVNKFLEFAIKTDIQPRENWIFPNIRLANVNMGDFCLPSEKMMEGFYPSPTRIPVYIFLDASGSVIDMKDRFFKLVRSIPKDVFTVHLCSFDTQVYELDIDIPEMIGGGGTSFGMIEEYIQMKTGGGKKYPKLVFFVTDGHASDSVKPEKPENWIVLLTENGSNRCYPSNCKTHNLKDFE